MKTHLKGGWVEKISLQGTHLGKGFHRFSHKGTQRPLQPKLCRKGDKWHLQVAEDERELGNAHARLGLKTRKNAREMGPGNQRIGSRKLLRAVNMCCGQMQPRSGLLMTLERSSSCSV